MMGLLFFFFPLPLLSVFAIVNLSDYGDLRGGMSSAASITYKNESQ